MTFENFGRNLRFTPAQVVTARTTADVIACLDRYRDRKIRAVGRLHSCSEVPVGDEVVLDLGSMKGISLEHGHGNLVSVRIEAGCTIEEVLEYLRSHGGYTLPTYSMISRQTVVGAIATATHGAGRPSLSHYVSAVSVAAYDAESGRARVYEWDSGDELRALRCSLGRAGIVLAVRVAVESDYLIEERTSWFTTIEEILEQEPAFPLQQFYLVPWSWRWYAQLRRAHDRKSGARRSSTADLQRYLRRVGVDALLNGIVKLLSNTIGWGTAVQWLYRWLFPLIARPGMLVTDHSKHLLLMRHDFYIHVEMELFVPASCITRAAAFVEWALRRCAGEPVPLPQRIAHDRFGAGIEDAFDSLSYVHDHVITIRRVLRDDALISMTADNGTDVWYAISLMTYQRDRGPFLQMSALVARAMTSAYGARPHWGKICPLDAADIVALYPALPRFRAHCSSVDPDQVFANAFTKRVLGF
jgi:FAD/FMN-containing dehydrogenase